MAALEARDSSHASVTEVEEQRFAERRVIGDVSVPRRSFEAAFG